MWVITNKILLSIKYDILYIYLLQNTTNEMTQLTTILYLFLTLYLTNSLSTTPVFVPSDVYCEAGNFDHN
jgi:hypothetical protein